MPWVDPGRIGVVVSTVTYIYDGLTDDVAAERAVTAGTTQTF